MSTIYTITFAAALALMATTVFTKPRCDKPQMHLTGWYCMGDDDEARSYHVHAGS